MSATAAARFRARPEFGFACLDAADRDALRAERFETRVSLNVLEHIEDDVAALRAFPAVLPPGGTLARPVPAHPVLYGRYDALDGHHRRNARHALAARVEAAGIDLAALRYHDALGGPDRLVQYRRLRRTIHSEGTSS